MVSHLLSREFSSSTEAEISLTNSGSLLMSVSEAPALPVLRPPDRCRVRVQRDQGAGEVRSLA